MADTGYTIVLDFDGTVVKHRYPAVGEDIGAVPVLKRLAAHGHRIILNTMRGRNCEGKDTLQPALDWFEERGIPLYGANINPDQTSWTSSTKVYGHIYIDDSALGAPLAPDPEGGSPFIDWNITAALLYQSGLLDMNDIVQMVQAGQIRLAQKK